MGPDKTIEMVIFKEILKCIEDKITEEDIEMINIMIIIEVGTDQEKGQSQEIIIMVEIEVQVTVDLGQDPGLVQIEIG